MFSVYVIFFIINAALADLDEKSFGWQTWGTTDTPIIETAAITIPFPTTIDSFEPSSTVETDLPLTTTIATIAATPQLDPACLNCQCGVANKQQKIVGGMETMVNEYPWVSLLLYRGRFYCGSTVINSKYVLTAAHCTERFSPASITVRVNEHDRASASETTTYDYKVEKVIRHADYSNTLYDNDIALLKIKGTFNFTTKFRPVCLPEPEKSYAGEKGIVTGWGATAQGGQVSSVLREVTVPIMSNADCRTLTKYPAKKITDNMLCAGYKEGGKDSCQGDSGGAIHVLSGDGYHIVGITSWGEGCAKPNYPGVYTRVNRYLDWIQKNTEDSCYCTQKRIKKF